jgi:hypothetical protein
MLLFQYSWLGDDWDDDDKKYISWEGTCKILITINSMWNKWNLFKFIRVRKYVVSFLGRDETESTWYVSHYLAYCTSPGRQMIMSVEQSVEWLARETELLWENLPSASFPSQIPHDLNWARTQATMVGSRQLTAWAIARPLGNIFVQFIIWCMRSVQTMCKSYLTKSANMDYIQDLCSDITF